MESKKQSSRNYKIVEQYRGYTIVRDYARDFFRIREYPALACASLKAARARIDTMIYRKYVNETDIVKEPIVRPAAKYSAGYLAEMEKYN